jgi:protein TonB
MAYHLRWRRAAMVSVLCHIFFLLGAGYLSAHLSPPIVQEQIIELELVSEAQAETNEDLAASSEAMKSPPAPKQPAQLTPVSVSQPIPSTPKVVTSMDIAEALPATGVSSNEANSESPESTESGNSAGGGSSVNSSNSTNGSGSTGAGGKRSGLIPPSILSKVEPPYPQSARQAGIEGTVLVKIEILANGHSGNITVSRSSGHEILDEAALSTVEQWRFVPAKDRNSGQAIACYTTIPISFRLR